MWPEVLIGLAAAGLLLCVLIPIGSDARRNARLGDDRGKLRQIASLSASYAADHSDLMPTFSWRPGTSPSMFPDLQFATTVIQASANQAVDIMRRRGGRLDIPLISNWIPQIFFNHLVIADYGALRLPSKIFVSSGDLNRQKWAADPLAFDRGAFLPAQPEPSGTNKRWPYSSSFQTPTVFYDRSAPPNRISQASTHALYMFLGAPDLGPILASQVAFPSMKVQSHDGWAWHFGPALFSGYTQARLPLLMADGSVIVRATAESNRGWLPNTPTSPAVTTLSYQPSPWEPPVPTAYGSTAVGHYRWTRGTATRSGLAGRDFGGPEPTP